MTTAISGSRANSAAWPRARDCRSLLIRYFEGKTQLRRGLCLLNARRYDQAIRVLSAAADANPANLSLPSYLAAAYLGSGRPERAAEEFSRAASRDPKDATVRVRHALALYKSGHPRQAIAVLREGIAENPESAELHFQLGTLLSADGGLEEAELRFMQAHAIDGHHPEALVNLALCRGAAGDAGAALRWLKRAQAEDPSNARTALLLAHAAQASDSTAAVSTPCAMPPDASTDDEASIAELASIFERDPNFIEAFLSLETSDMDSRVFTMLAATLERALERSPEHADLHYHCGRVMSRLGRTDEAIQAIEEAIHLRPRFVSALIQLARLYQQTSRTADARSRLEETVRLGVEYADVYFLLGNLYRDGGLVDRALEAYRQALRINPRFEDARQALAHVLS